MYHWLKKIYGKKLKKYLKNRLEDHQFYDISYTEPNDIFITGYPKSGNTWMQRIVSGLIYDINPQFATDRLAQELVPDIYAYKFYKRYHSKLQCFKSHELPKKEYRRVIYIIRDGRDAMCSYYAMLKSMGKDYPFTDIIKKGTGIYPCKWHQHVEEWYKNPFNAEIIYIQYENLLNNPFPQLEKICRFLKIDRDDEVLNKVINGTTFEKLKKMEELEGHYNLYLNKNKEFFRKGKIGNYKEEMPEDLQRYFLKEANDQLKLFGYIK